MSHAVESMFWAGREVPWHGLGKQVIEAPNSREAIKHAGLDWKVRKQPVFTSFGLDPIVVPDTYANIRESDGAILGLVGGYYKILQNVDAFDFVDSLVGGGDVRYETAGSLHGGKKVFLLARMPAMQILGDEVVPYLIFTNSHDGKSAVRAALTPVRVVCQNTLNVALKGASRIFSVCHKGDIVSKVQAAQRILGLSESYLGSLQADAELLRQIVVSDIKAGELCEQLFMPNGVDELTDRQYETARSRVKALRFRYDAVPDLDSIRGTGWAFINAVADYVNHEPPTRLTATYKDKLVEGAIGEYDLLNEAHKLLLAA